MNRLDVCADRPTGGHSSGAYHALKRFLVLVLLLLHICYVQATVLQPESWLRSCVNYTDEVQPLVCNVTKDVTLAATSESFPPILLQRSLVVEGADRAPTLNLSASSGLFSLPPAARLTIRRLRLVDVALQDAFSISPTAFLRLSAFSFATSSSSSVAASQPPQLFLEDLQLETRSCKSLIAHQVIACGVSPSPNFTVAPGKLHVHFYTYITSSNGSNGITLHARNVTLHCSGGSPFPEPCWARNVDSAAELRDVLLAAADTGVERAATRTPPLALNLLLSRSFALREVWDATDPLSASSTSSGCPTAVPPSPSQPGTFPPQQPCPQPTSPPTQIKIFAQPLVLSGGAVAASVDGAPPPVVLDLAGTASRLLLATGTARVELRNLTLVNPPLGPVTMYPSSLLALPLWTIQLPNYRLLPKLQSMDWILDVRGVAIHLAHSELALWHEDVLSAVPNVLMGSFCAYGNNLLLPGPGIATGQATKEPWWAIALPGGGLYTLVLRSLLKGWRWYENVLLLPPQPPTAQQQSQQQQEQQQERQQQNMGPPVATAAAISTQSPQASASRSTTTATTTNISATSRATSLPPLPPQLSPLCQLYVESGDSNPLALPNVKGFASPMLNPVQLVRNLSYDNYQTPDYLVVLNIDTVLCADGCNSDALLNTDLETQQRSCRLASVAGQQVVLGDPQQGRPQLLHMSCIPAMINVRAEGASLMLRQLVLTGLPPAWMQPPSATRQDDVGQMLSLQSAGHHRSWRRVLGREAAGSISNGSSRQHNSRLTQELDAAAVGNAATTGSLAATYTNLTSCLWSLDFDRHIANLSQAPPSFPTSLSELQPRPAASYRVFLDSVVLVVKPRELALMAWAWAEHLRAAAGGNGGGSSSDINGSTDAGASTGIMGEEVEAAGANPISTAPRFEFTLASPLQSAAEEMLTQLRAMPQTSQLSMTETATSLELLTVRLLDMADLVQTSPTSTSSSSSSGGDGSGGSCSNSSVSSSCAAPTNSAACFGDSTLPVGSSTPVNPLDPPASLTFKTFSWCGMLGRNVTLSATLPPGISLSVKFSYPWVWNERLDLPLVLSRHWQQPGMAAEASSPTGVSSTPSPSPLLAPQSAASWGFQPSEPTAAMEPASRPYMDDAVLDRQPPPNGAISAGMLPETGVAGSPTVVAANGSASILRAVLASVAALILAVAVVVLLLRYHHRQQKSFKTDSCCSLSKVDKTLARCFTDGDEAAGVAARGGPSLLQQEQFPATNSSTQLVAVVSSLLRDLNVPRDKCNEGAAAEIVEVATARMHPTACGKGSRPLPHSWPVKIMPQIPCYRMGPALPPYPKQQGNSTEAQNSQQLLGVSCGVSSSGFDAGDCDGSSTGLVSKQWSEKEGAPTAAAAGGQAGTVGQCFDNLQGIFNDRDAHDVEIGTAAAFLSCSGSLTGHDTHSHISNDNGGSGGGGSNSYEEPGLVLLGKLGHGAQGVVYRGLWRGLDVAIKRVLFHQSTPGGGISEPQQHPNPIHEAAIAATVAHPNVVATYTHQLHQLQGPQCLQQQHQTPNLVEEQQQVALQAGKEGNVWRLTLVQELCDAGSLRHCLDSGLLAACNLVVGPGTAINDGSHCHVAIPIYSVYTVQKQLDCRPHCPAVASSKVAAPPPPLMPAVALALALQAARGMAYLHALGVLHGDLSSANVLLQSCPALQPAPSQAAQQHSLHQVTPEAPGAALVGETQQHSLRPAALVEAVDHQVPRLASVAPDGLSHHAAAAPPPSLPANDPDYGLAFWSRMMVIQGCPPVLPPWPSAAQTGPASWEAQRLQQGQQPELQEQQSVQGPELQGDGGVLRRVGNGSQGCASSSSASNSKNNAKHSGGDAAGKCGRNSSCSYCSRLCSGFQGGIHHPQSCFVVGSALCDSRQYRHEYIAKVADFGLSGRLEGDATHLSRHCRGFSVYSAPELFRSGICSKGTDVYAFAVVLYEMVVGMSLPQLLRDPRCGPGLRDWLVEHQRRPPLPAIPPPVGCSRPPHEQRHQQREQGLEQGLGGLPAALPPSLLLWPQGVPSGVVALVAECLAEDPAARPTFDEICLRLQRQLEALLSPLHRHQQGSADEEMLRSGALRYLAR